MRAWDGADSPENIEGSSVAAPGKVGISGLAYFRSGVLTFYEQSVLRIARSRIDMATFNLSVNGQLHRIEADPDMPLLWALRDMLRLTGTKYGCGSGVCGACTVHENGEAIRSCLITLSATQGKRYTTIEGLSTEGDHPCQLAWVEEDVAQCGYCQAGAIMETAALIKQKPNVTDADIDASLGNHVCRCGTYQRMRRAVHRAAGQGART
jgi:isoquinoline 1-oxidoreductase alpha subunit